jgi:plasmid stabilization system protein ParE
MLFNVNFSDESLLDIRETREYYSQVSLIILKKFDDELTKSIELLKVNPNHFQKRYRNIKIVFTKKFPFGIHYIFENNRIYIQRILHQIFFYN